MSQRILSCSAIVLIAALLGVHHARGETLITSFTPGNLVLMRGGDAVHPQSTYGNGEVPAYLDEYTPAGVYVGSYPIPTDTLTLPGATQNSHEGRLNLSGDGHYLNFAGYQQAVNSATPRVTDGTGSGSYYQVGQVSGNGVYAGTSLNTAVATPQYLRAAYSNDGSSAWVASKNPNGGLEYVTGIGGSGTTTALQTTTDWRDVKVQSGQFYGGTGSSSVGVHGFYAIGSGQPTSGTPANTLLSNSGNNSVSGFSAVTLPGNASVQPINGVSGVNTEYVVGDPSGQAYIGKLYTPSSGTALTTSVMPFASRQIITAAIPGPEGIIANIDPTNSTWVDLYVVASDGVYFAIDKSGSPNGSFGTLSFTKIISAAADGSTTFYGIANAPTAVPEPGTLVLGGLGILGFVVARLRQRRS